METEPTVPQGAGQPGEIILTNQERTVLLADIMSDEQTAANMNAGLERARIRHQNITQMGRGLLMLTTHQRQHGSPYFAR